MNPVPPKVVGLRVANVAVLGAGEIDEGEWFSELSCGVSYPGLWTRVPYGELFTSELGLAGREGSLTRACFTAGGRSPSYVGHAKFLLVSVHFKFGFWSYLRHARRPPSGSIPGPAVPDIFSVSEVVYFVIGTCLILVRLYGERNIVLFVM